LIGVSVAGHAFFALSLHA